MARGPGLVGRPRPDTVAMPKRGKRLKFRAHDACSGRGGRRGGGVERLGAGGREGAGRRRGERSLACNGRALGPGTCSEQAGGLGGEDADREKASSSEGCCCISVTVADYANSDPAVVRSGRVKKAVANAVQQEGRLPTSLSGREDRTRCFIFLELRLSVFLAKSFGHFPINVFAVFIGPSCIRRRGQGGLAKSSNAFYSRNILFLSLHPKKKKIFACSSVGFTAFFLAIHLFPVVHIYSPLILQFASLCNNSEVCFSFSHASLTFKPFTHMSLRLVLL